MEIICKMHTNRQRNYPLLGEKQLRYLYIGLTQVLQMHWVPKNIPDIMSVRVLALNCLHDITCDDEARMSLLTVVKYLSKIIFIAKQT
jgi:hypothetical protein